MPFKPGESGNPKGAPHWADTFGTVYNRLLAMTPEELEAYQPKNGKEKLCKDVITEKKDYKEIADRIDGKAKQYTESRDLTAEDSPIYRAIKEIKK